VIGFLLPSFVFLIGVSQLLSSFEVWLPMLEFDAGKPIETGAVFGLMIWVFAILLQAMNRELFRVAEGYAPRFLWDWCGCCTEKRRFRELCDRLEALRIEFDESPEEKHFEKEDELKEIWRQRASEFPSKEGLVLPTRFGNVVRAYEDYSRLVHGFESVNGWARLQAVMSNDFREVLGRFRSRVDLWLNLWVLALVFSLALVAAVAVGGWSIWGVLLILGTLGLSRAAYLRSVRSAEIYGEQVKAAFDVYLPKLAGMLGFDLSAKPKINRAFWQSYSQMMVNPEPDSMEAIMASGVKRISERKGEQEGDEQLGLDEYSI
jgi:hypothetical protein